MHMQAHPPGIVTASSSPNFGSLSVPSHAVDARDKGVECGIHHVHPPNQSALSATHKEDSQSSCITSITSLEHGVESMEEAESFQGLDGFELLRRRRRQ
ncbi:hypothetical protein MUK42_32730 [Musa troglodytarum]|uniref:Uncharacterized protein n=1 Tax=Musa troglodytarum TaxID=320322 RepID=A0A9E7FEM5_9LILI|nr:hypothetical protein MUK42_32730 [Musa troglodytarum]